jgi:hypothetical protein
MPTHQSVNHFSDSAQPSGTTMFIKVGYALLGFGLIFFALQLGSLYLSVFAIHYWYRFISRELFSSLQLFASPKNQYVTRSIFLALTVFAVAFYSLQDLVVLDPQTYLSIFLLFFGYYMLDQIQFQKNAFSSQMIIHSLPAIGFLLLGATRLAVEDLGPNATLMRYMGYLLGLYLLTQTFKMPEVQVVQPSTEHSSQDDDKEDDQGEDSDNVESQDPPQVEYLPLPASIEQEIKDLGSVEEIQTLVSIPDGDMTVIAMVVVSNTISQERMFDIKQKTRKILKDNGYPESVIELMYKIEYEKLG